MPQKTGRGHWRTQLQPFQEPPPKFEKPTNSWWATPVASRQEWNALAKDAEDRMIWGARKVLPHGD